jgi:lipid-binding SYLF domain-containing protein
MEKSTKAPQTTSKTAESAKVYWEKTKVATQAWFDKIGPPMNKLSNKLGAETFWPTPLDKESEKAARILRSFCIDGCETEENAEKQGAALAGGKPSTDKKLKRHQIPQEASFTAFASTPPSNYQQVIRNAKGLAIFTVLRAGLHWSGAGGSGVVVRKLSTGTWSPPSAILIHTLGWGFVAGADIYDCVAVINADDGMEGFATRPRFTLGGEVSAAVGPVGAGGALDSEVFRRRAPVWSYVKSRGLYVGVQIDGTVVAERKGENERFYGVEKVAGARILAGDVTPPPGAFVTLWETLQAIEGRAHDQSKLPPPGEPSPGDHVLENPRETSEREYDEFADKQDRMSEEA